MEQVIKNASDIHDVAQLYTSVQDSLNSPREQLDALIDVRNTAPLNAAALRDINTKIGDLAQFTHQHPDG